MEMDEKPMTDKTQTIYSAGIDIGSTTAKVVICVGTNRVVFARYQRHQGETEKRFERFYRRPWTNWVISWFRCP